MDVGKETQRAGYAFVGACARAVDSFNDALGNLAQLWRERDQWAQHAGAAYDELARHGHTLMGRAERDARRMPGVAPVEGEMTGLVAEEDELPITHYGDRTAADIAQQLPGLSQRELHVIEAYETRTRARRTILRRIDELRGQEPWPGYDEMGVDEILPHMRTASPDEQATVIGYEQHHKQRRSITTDTHG